jgi:hypothetical protein
VLVDVLENIAADVYGPYITENKKGKTVGGAVQKCALRYDGRQPFVL